MGASACVAYITYFFTVSSDVLDVNGVVFVAVVGFRKEFACGTTFAGYVEAVMDCFVCILSCVKGDNHEGGVLAFKTLFNWLDSSCQDDGFGCERVG